MKKLLSFLMLATASLMLVFAAAPEVQAYTRIETVEFEIFEDDYVTEGTFDTLNDFISLHGEALFMLLRLSVKEFYINGVLQEDVIFAYQNGPEISFSSDTSLYDFFIDNNDLLVSEGISTTEGDVITITFEVNAAVVVESETFTITVSGASITQSASGDRDIYDFLNQFFIADSSNGIIPEVAASITTLDYVTSRVSKHSGYYQITFEDDEELTYIVQVFENETVSHALGDLSIPNGTYTLTLTVNGYGAEAYQDLFYERLPIEFTVTHDGSANLWPENFSTDLSIDDFEKIAYEIVEDAVFAEMSDDWFSVELDFYIAYYNDDIIQLLFDDTYPFSISLVINENEVVIEAMDYEHYTFVLGETITFTLTTGNDGFLYNIPWTQSYSYGRYRTESTETYFLNHIDDAVHLSTINSSSTVFDPDDVEPNDIITVQSPYKNFSVGYGTNIIISQEDVAAVGIQRIDASSNYNFYIWYWEDNEIQYRQVLNVDLASVSIKWSGGIRAAISTEETFVANVDNLVPLEDFLEYIVAWDDLHGDISDQVYIDDDGDYQPDVVGTYTVTFAVADSEDNISTLEVLVHVVDIVAPVISGTSTPVTISYHQEFNVAAWVASLTVSDNYYTGLTISVLTNTYSGNKTSLGDYEITVRAIDGSGNIGTLTRYIEVVDGLGPVFTGISTISASIQENLTVDQIKAALAAVDAKDGNVTSAIEVDSDELTGNNQTPGTYTVVFVVEDAAGNQTFHEVTATIFSAPPGIYVLDGSSVRLLPGATLTIEQILEVLGVTDGYENLSTNYVAGVPGVYNLSFTYLDETFNIDITVLGAGDPVLPPPVIPGENPTSDYSWTYWIAATVAFLAVGYFVFKKKK